jgi:membrane fusion protein (multidrug efflux system)
MHMSKAGIGSILVMAVLAAAYFLWPGSDETTRGPSARGPVAVIVHEVGRAEYVEKIEALGTLKANESVTLTAQVRETVTRVNFEDGAVVSAGDILLEFTNEEESALLREAQANLTEAQKQLERIRGLVAKGTSTQARLDQQIREAGSARARVEAIAARLTDRLLRAPFAGLLGFRMVSEGTLVDPGAAVTTLDDIDRVKLDFSVPETYIAALKVGLAIEAKSAAYPDRVFKGTVSTVDSRIDPVSRAVTVRAIIPNDERLLRPGMLVTVELERSRTMEIMIPEEALIQRQWNNYVYLVDENDMVEQRQIEVAGRRLGALVVQKGLSEGETVIVEGISKVFPGNPVTRQSSRGLDDMVTAED